MNILSLLRRFNALICFNGNIDLTSSLYVLEICSQPKRLLPIKGCNLKKVSAIL